MKKTLLFAFALGIGASASAQNNARLMRMISHPAKNNVKKYNEIVLDQNSQLAPYKPQSKTTSAGCIDAGHSGNLLGYYTDGHSNLWANPQSGLVGHVHRSDAGTTGAPNSGFLYTSYSKDFGATWTQDEGPAYANDAGTGTLGPNFSVARYPNTAMVYPSIGTADASNPDSTYFVFTSAVRNNSNPGAASADWGAHGYGVYKPGGVQKTQHQLSTDSITPNGKRFYVIAEDFHSTQTNETWTLEIGNYQALANGAQYQDTLYLDHGRWNPVSHDVDVTVEKVYAPVGHVLNDKDLIVDGHIGFAPNGLDGWISFLGHSASYAAPHADSLYYPILYHTVNGGVTWTGPIEVDLANITGLTKAVGDSVYFDATASPNVRHCTGFRHDLAVDYLGRPHLILGIGVLDYATDPTAAAWNTSRGAAVSTITCDANGTNWSGTFLAWPMAYQSCYGDCAPALGTDYYVGYNRAQVATTWDHKNMIYAWADADTNLFAPINTTYSFSLQNPDVWVAANDLVGGGWTSNPATSAQSLAITAKGKNITKQTCADAQAVYFNLSHYVFQPVAGAFNFEIPIAYSEFDISAGGAALGSTTVTHKYIKSAFVGINEKTKVNESVSLDVYPNPTNGNLNINYVLPSSSSVSVELYNMIGAKVATISNATAQAPGRHLVTVDMSAYSAGVYFVKANINGAVSATKVVKN